MMTAEQRHVERWLPTEVLHTTDRSPMRIERVAWYVGLMERNDDSPGHVLVEPCSEVDGYNVLDGRHRWLAHVILGRTKVRCLVEVPAGSHEERA